MESTRLYTYVCSSVADKGGKTVKRGCGGRWTPELPDACPRCGGPIVHLDTTAVIQLSP